MRTVQSRIKRGFTLIETIVTVGIVATLAAIVVPEVVKQFDESEPTRIQQDLKNLQTAISTFNVNVKATPGDIDDLANPINATDDSLITTGGQTSLFSTTQSNAWNGPYIDVSLIENSTEATRETGNAATISDDFVCFNATDNATASNGVSGDQDCPTATIAATDRLFLAIRINGLGATVADARFIAINDLFDGTLATETAARGDTGRIRFVGSQAYYLAMPLN